MDWWENWGTLHSAAFDFLDSGNARTAIGGNHCRSSAECASGQACSGGKCVAINSESSSDGTLSSCGGEGGGGCDALIIRQGMTASDAMRRGFSWDGGVGTKSFRWESVYAADGCTIAGCKLTACGGEFASDCPGPRYCRFFLGGGVSCACGEPPKASCTVFCDSYLASFGAGAAGCEGKVCDECATCDGNYFSSTYNTCIPQTGGPCHCEPGNLPECYKCNEQGTTELDTNCKECYTTNVDCGCGEIFQKTCCYTLEELKNGLTGYNRCAESVDCSEVCKAYVDPCEGECTPQKIGPLPGTCQDIYDAGISVADGHRTVVTGCIEAGGQATVLYNDCDMTNVPESCKECDCNCNNDCPYCQVCNESTGKCVADTSDPNCVEQTKTSTWYVPGSTVTSGNGKYRTCTFFDVCNEYNLSGPSHESLPFSYTTPIAGPTPHSLELLEDTREFLYGCYDVVTGGCNCSYLPGGCYGDAAPYSGAMSESVVIRYRVKDADGNTLGDINAFVVGNNGRVTVQPAVNTGGVPSLVSYN